MSDISNDAVSLDPPAGETPGEPVPGVLVTGGPTAPAVGGIVLVLADPATNNGADTAPAVITRVWNPVCINARVLHDGEAISWRTSVTYVDDLDDIAPDDLGRLGRWSWPPRT